MSKILVAEDDFHVRSLVTVTLEQKGHQVYEVGSGSEALEKLFRHGPMDVILLDVMLPGMDDLLFATKILPRTTPWPTTNLMPL